MPNLTSFKREPSEVGRRRPRSWNETAAVENPLEHPHRPARKTVRHNDAADTSIQTNTLLNTVLDAMLVLELPKKTRRVGGGKKNRTAAAPFPTMSLYAHAATQTRLGPKAAVVDKCERYREDYQTSTSVHSTPCSWNAIHSHAHGTCFTFQISAGQPCHKNGLLSPPRRPRPSPLLHLL